MLFAAFTAVKPCAQVSALDRFYVDPAQGTNHCSSVPARRIRASGERVVRTAVVIRSAPFDSA